MICYNINVLINQYLMIFKSLEIQNIVFVEDLHIGGYGDNKVVNVVSDSKVSTQKNKR